MPFQETSKPLPDENTELKQGIEALCKRVGYNLQKVELTEDDSGDLHSNAAISSQKIGLSEELLKHHAGHDDEILAIIAHELGHWKKWHMLRGFVFDSFYMLVFGAILIPLISRPAFLEAFNFHQDNFFVLLCFYTALYIHSVDVPIRLLIRKISRTYELEADSFSVQLGFGEAAYRALVRNHAQNKDVLFTSRLLVLLEYTHPPLLDRLAHIERLT